MYMTKEEVNEQPKNQGNQSYDTVKSLEGQVKNKPMAMVIVQLKKISKNKSIYQLRIIGSYKLNAQRLKRPLGQCY